MITDSTARRIASEWYGGQWSALYLLVCNSNFSRLSIADFNNMIDEVDKELHACVRRILERSTKETTDLLHLKTWLADQIAKRE